jgi:HEAT repeat protein
VLSAILSRTEYVEVQRAAVAALGATGDPAALPVLEAYLNADDAQLRFQAAAAVLRLTTGTTLPPAA